MSSTNLEQPSNPESASASASADSAPAPKATTPTPADYNALASDFAAYISTAPTTNAQYEEILAKTGDDDPVGNKVEAFFAAIEPSWNQYSTVEHLESAFKCMLSFVNSLETGRDPKTKTWYNDSYGEWGCDETVQIGKVWKDKEDVAGYSVRERIKEMYRSGDYRYLSSFYFNNLIMEIWQEWDNDLFESLDGEESDEDDQDEEDESDGDDDEEGDERTGDEDEEESEEEENPRKKIRRE
jgi:hypothetical protein